MKKTELIEEKEKIFKEIIDKRAELKEVNDMIKAVGSSISFFKFFIIPLVVAIAVALLTSLIKVNSNQSTGAILVSFIAAFAVSTFYNRKQIAARKEELIAIRMSLQKDLVDMGKRLTEIEKELNS